MQISDGKLYLNRTWKYIYPALRVYGFQPISYLNELIKQGVGIYDLNFEEDDPDPKIFILIQTQVLNLKLNKKEYEGKISRFFEFIRRQDYYVSDYIYDIDRSCCSHMLVLKFPQEFKDIFKSFKQGKYSEMYSQKIISKYFPNSNLSKLFNSNSIITTSKTLGTNLEIHGVLSKSSEYKEEFIKSIKKDFEVEVSNSEVSELDYPPVLSEEIFNYT